MRSRPWVGADSELFEPLLETDQKLFVIDGPKRGSDYDWYLVHAITGPWFNVGWVAAADHDGTPWIEPSSISCPANPSFTELAAMRSVARLNCYGSRDFEFTDTITVGPMCGDGNSLAGPDWMVGCLNLFAWGAQNADMYLAVPADLAEGLGEREPDDSFKVTVVAHMDDPAAQTCSLVPGWEGELDYEIENPSHMLQCRTFFVATSLELAP